MEYLITIYPDSYNPKIGDKPSYKVLSEKAMFQFIQENIGRRNFTISRIELLLDLS